MTGLGRGFKFASTESSALPSAREVPIRALVAIPLLCFAGVFGIGAIADRAQQKPDAPTVTVTCPAPRADEGLSITVTAREDGGFTHRCSTAAGEH